MSNATKESNQAANQANDQEQIENDLRAFIAKSRFEPILIDGLEMSQRFLSWSLEQHARYIRCLASDLGRLGDAKFSKLNIGKVTKKSEMLLKAGIDSNKVDATPSLKTYRLCQLLNEAFSLGWTIKRGLLAEREDTLSWINK